MRFIIQCLAILAVSIVANPAGLAEAQIMSKLFGKPLATSPDQISGASQGANGSGLLGGDFKMPSLGSLLNQGASQPKASPGFLDQFNARSKSAIDRTTEWARGKQQKLQQKALGGLKGMGDAGGVLGSTNNVLGNANNLLGGGVRNLFGGVNQPSAEAASTGPAVTESTAEKLAETAPDRAPARPDYYGAGTQPPIRAAANPTGQSTQRF